MPHLAPTTTAELTELIADAAAHGRRLEIRAGGSKAGVGAGGRNVEILDMRGFAGVVDYDPAELVLTVRPGTPLAEVERLVSEHGQMLAFEPFDHGPLFGQAAGQATIGGIVAAGVSGSRRPAMGAVRDHLLGIEGVSGRGERFVAGAKVVKNVTGYDVPKLMCGSWGRLVALTELTLKVLPAPRESVLRVVRGLGPEAATAALARALGSQADVSAALHLPGGAEPVTVFRLQGFRASVAARAALLSEVLRDHRVETPDTAEADAIWRTARDLTPLADGRPLWRLSVPPRTGGATAAALERAGASWLMDWGGGLLWVAFDGDAAQVRAAATTVGGHAMLVRDDAGRHAGVPTFQPLAGPVAALEARVRRAFDPAGVFETGRFGDQAHAD